ncbi:hypothetical protein ABEB36_003294, partial [Hypothenemus hampei]
RHVEQLLKSVCSGPRRLKTWAIHIILQSSWREDRGRSSIKMDLLNRPQKYGYFNNGAIQVIFLFEVMM